MPVLQLLPHIFLLSLIMPVFQKINPCCGVKLQSGVKIVAVFTIVWSLLHGCFQLFEIVSYRTGTSIAEEDTEYDYAANHEDLNRVRMIFALGLGIGLTVKLALSYLLYTGASQLNPRRCKIWFYGIIVIVIYEFACYVLSPFEESWKVESVLAVVEPILYIYLTVVVHSFIVELQSIT